MLLEFGLSADDKNNWYLQEGDELVPHPQEALHYQLCHAVQSNNFEKLRLLVEHGVDINKVYDDRSPYQLALLVGNEAMMEYLLAHGAENRELAAVDQFRIACLKPERKRARELLNLNPKLIDEVFLTSPDILEHAIAAPEPDALLLMLELGFDVNHMTYRTALHQAAWLGRVDMMQILIDAGANPTLRDQFYFGPPIAWALQNNQDAAVEFLDNCRMDIFTATAREKKPELERLLKSKPQLMETRFGDIRPNKNKSCEMDWMTPLAFAIASQKVESVKFLLERGANTSVHNRKGLSAKGLARDHDDHQILKLIVEHDS